MEDTHADVSELRTQGERVAATLRGQAQQETLQKQQLARNHKVRLRLRVRLRFRVRANANANPNANPNPNAHPHPHPHPNPKQLAVTLMQAAAEPEVLQESIADAEAENTRLLGIIDELGQEQPQYAPQLSLLAQSISQR